MSFAFGSTAARLNMPWLTGVGEIAQVDTGERNVRDHHSHSHAGTRESIGMFMNWYSTKIAELVDKLKLQRPDGTRLLDTTTVLWTTEYGAGGPHTNNNVPHFVFGSGGGLFRTGQHIRFDNDAKHTHALMVSLIEASGVKGVTQFGNPKGGSGPLAPIYA